MKNSAVNSAKKTTVKSAIVNVNLSAFADKLSKIDVKEKNVKETIYNYPENFTAKMISEVAGKKHRNSLRNSLKRFENNIFVFTKTNNAEKLNAEIKAFNDFYKANYKINDYSLKSLSHSANETKTGELQLMLDIIKQCNSSEKTITKKVSAKK